MTIHKLASEKLINVASANKLVNCQEVGPRNSAEFLSVIFERKLGDTRRSFGSKCYKLLIGGLIGSKDRVLWREKRNDTIILITNVNDLPQRTKVGCGLGFQGEAEGLNFKFLP